MVKAIKKPCEHTNQPVKVGKHTVYASGHRYQGSAEWRKGNLGLFIALDDAWLHDVVGVICPIATKIKPPAEATLATIPTILVDWWDGKACPHVDWLLTTVTEALSKGTKVGVACQGGHGRTGTLLAMLIGKLEGLDPFNAIEETQKRYCESAVESQTQVEQVYTVLGADLTRVAKEWIFQSYYTPPPASKPETSDTGGWYDSTGAFHSWSWTVDKPKDSVDSDPCKACTTENCATCNRWNSAGVAYGGVD